MKVNVKTIENDLEYVRQISKEVSFKNKNYKREVETLEKYCIENSCFALAAIQIGIPKRMIYLRNTTDDMMKNFDSSYSEAKVLINPVVISKKGHTKYWESCLCCLDNMGLVSRPYEIIIEYYDIDGVFQTETFKDFAATVLSHELDHLDGRLHIDIAEEIKYMNQEERIEFRKTHPYEIISKTCDYDKIKFH